MTGSEGIRDAQEALHADPMTADDYALHDRLIARQKARERDLDPVEVKFRDCLDFARAHAFAGSGKYRNESEHALVVALELLRGGQ